jgi:hypothetical protein
LPLKPHVHQQPVAACSPSSGPLPFPAAGSRCDITDDLGLLPWTTRISNNCRELTIASAPITAVHWLSAEAWMYGPPSINSLTFLSGEYAESCLSFPVQCPVYAHREVALASLTGSTRLPRTQLVLWISLPHTPSQQALLNHRPHPFPWVYSTIFGRAAQRCGVDQTPPTLHTHLSVFGTSGGLLPPGSSWPASPSAWAPK